MSQRELKLGGAKLPSMTSWLDVLRGVLPPRGVLLIGAGAGDGLWVQWLLRRAMASDGALVHLIEGDEQQYRHLQHSLPTNAGWVSRHDVVAGSSTSTIFHRASNPAESGLLKPESLQQLWPHLGTEQIISIEDPITLDELRQQAAGEINWLILDCLPAANLLQGGAKLLPQLDVALVRVAQDLPAELKADQQSVDNLLRAAGLRCVHTESERHPALAHALYVRDTAQVQEQTRSLGEQLAAAKHAWAKEKAELTRAREGASQKAQTAEHAKAAAEEQAQKLSEQLKVAQETWATEKAELTRAKDAATQKAQAAEQARASAEEQAQKLGEQLKVAQEQAQKLQDQQLDTYRQSINSLRKDLRATFGKDLKNAVKQIEAFVSIQNYLNAGESITGFHDWPISPDIGLFLIERIRERHHDLIIEFGSGTSTALFAKVLQLEQRADTSRALLAGGEPARILCSFEHDQRYLRKTRDMLESHALTEMVKLTHAPLVDWQDDTGNYLYYDCETTLAELAQKLAGPAKRVLVLVDGPPGNICANARYPTVPHVFKRLARHQIDLVLDDANRAEEKSVIELWRAFWKKRSIHVTESSVTSEKGLFWVRNYDEEGN